MDDKDMLLLAVELREVRRLRRRVRSLNEAMRKRPGEVELLRDEATKAFSNSLGGA